jgi:DNA polymerase III subunit delta'
MLFGNIQGHEGIIKRFERDLVSDSFKGVYLFTGPSSVGKYTVARLLARYLLCTGLIDDACRCETCRLLPNVPDYYEVSKGEDTIVTADIDAFIEFVSLVPYRSRRRVVIIDNAHNINPTAENRLLKTLEDLGSNCVVILITSHPERLFPTVVSRCYKIDFGFLGAEAIVSILKSKGHDTGKLSLMERMIPYLAGNVLVDFGKYSEYVKYVPQFIKKFPTMKEDDMLSIVKEIDEKQELPYFIEILVIFFNDIMKIRYDSPDVLLNPMILDSIEELSSQWKENICELFLEKFRNVHTQMRKNINLNFSQFVYPVFEWGFLFVQKEKVAVEAK